MNLLRQLEPEQTEQTSRVQVASGIAAVWAFRTCKEPGVVTLFASDQVPLWSREQIDDQSDKACKHDENHPYHSAIHTPGFGITRNPNQHGYVERNENYRY